MNERACALEVFFAIVHRFAIRSIRVFSFRNSRLESLLKSHYESYFYGE